MGNVLERILNGYFNVSYDEAKEFAVDIVNIIYINCRKCKFSKVYHDLTTFCGPNLECADKTAENIQNNLFPLFMRVEKLFEVIINADPKSDDDSLVLISQVF